MGYQQNLREVRTSCKSKFNGEKKGISISLCKACCCQENEGTLTEEEDDMGRGVRLCLGNEFSSD
jgi:hypothetical protein